MKTNKIFLLLILVTSLVFTSCGDDFMDVKTTSRMTADDAMKTMEADPSKLSGFVDAIYNVMVQYDLVSTNHDSFGYMSTMLATDLMSEDMVSSKLHHFQWDYKMENRDWTYRRTRVHWTYMYTIISSANNILGMTDPASTLPAIKGYRGQALALRGMAYYYLIQLYQHVYPVAQSGTRPGVPLYYAANEGKENILKRATVSEVLAQIESDLTTAVDNLKGSTRGTKNQIDENVANGLLARYYLLTEQWDKAALAARAAQSGSQKIAEPADLYKGFMDINDSEVMWGFDHNAETSTLYASYFSHISNLTAGYAGLNYAPKLIDKRLYESIPVTDARKKLFQDPTGTITVDAKYIANGAVAWKLPYANLKFAFDGSFAQDYTYMRAAEMVLIEAEALAHAGKGSDAATVLAKLMSKRDPAWAKSTVTVDDVWMQRRIELWGEGFSYFDLKRLNHGINRNYSGTNHEASARLAFEPLDKVWIYQIPNTEIQENPELEESDNNE